MLVRSPDTFTRSYTSMSSSSYTVHNSQTNPRGPEGLSRPSACCLQYGLLQKSHLGSWSQQLKHKMSAQIASASSRSSSATHASHWMHLGMQEPHPLHSLNRRSLFLAHVSVGQITTFLTSLHFGQIPTSIGQTLQSPSHPKFMEHLCSNVSGFT